MAGNVSPVIRLALFIGLPILELLILAELEDHVGLLATFALLVATGVVGASMVRRQGRMVWRSFQQRLAMGQIPETEIAHGAMLLVAGALLITPGVITDGVGLLLLIPWVRELFRVRFMKAIRVIVL